MRKTIATYTKWLLPILFIAYYSSIALFTHVHIEHGTTIVHSHPFNNTPDGKVHRHGSLAEIQLFHTLTTISVEDGAVYSLQLYFQTEYTTEISQVPVYPDHITSIQGEQSLRAPPAVC